MARKPRPSRRLNAEALEARRLLAASILNSQTVGSEDTDVGAIVRTLHRHNHTRPHDVNTDGRVTPQDALSVINELNRGFAANSSGASNLMCDTNGDDAVTPADALVVINSLNRAASSAASSTDTTDTTDNTSSDSSANDGSTSTDDSSDTTVGDDTSTDDIVDDTTDNGDSGSGDSGSDDTTNGDDSSTDDGSETPVSDDPTTDDGTTDDGTTDDGTTDDGTTDDGDCDHGQRPAPGAASLFDRADANDDGVITEDEVPAGVWDRLVAADADANSSVTQEELQTYLDNLHNEGDRPEHHPHHDHGLPPNIDPAALFARVDVNEDLLITEDEVPAAIWDKLLAADTDSSSSITLTELETYIDTLVADLPQREPPHHGHDRGPRHNHGPGNLANGIPVSPEALFSPIDKNGDGSLTEDEVPAVLWNRLVAADANSDGSVTLDEINEYIAGQTSPSQQTPPSAPTGQLAQGGVNTRVAGRLRR